jgi:hypothetical protein
VFTCPRTGRTTELPRDRETASDDVGVRIAQQQNGKGESVLAAFAPSARKSRAARHRCEPPPFHDETVKFLPWPSKHISLTTLGQEEKSLSLEPVKALQHCCICREDQRPASRDAGPSAAGRLDIPFHAIAPRSTTALPISACATHRILPTRGGSDHTSMASNPVVPKGVRKIQAQISETPIPNPATVTPTPATTAKSGPKGKRRCVAAACIPCKSRVAFVG